MLKVSRMLIQLKQEHERATVEPCLLAHDLNNGLNIIAGYCEIIVEDAAPDSESAKQLHLILEVVGSLTERINRQECRVGCAARNLKR